MRGNIQKELNSHVFDTISENKTVGFKKMFLRIEDAVLSEAAELPLSGFGPVFKPFSNSTAEEARCQLVGKRLR